MSSPAKSIQVKVNLVDGEHTLQVHGLRPLQVLQAMAESGINTTEEMTHVPAQVDVRHLNLIQKVAALALTFDAKDPWTVERIQSSFLTIQGVVEVFMACTKLSTESFGPVNPTGSSSKEAHHKSPYG